MSDPTREFPTLPDERVAPSTAARAGFVIISGLILLPIVYVGVFAFFVADEMLDLGYWDALDDQTEYVLQIIFWPLIQLYILLVGFGPSR